MSTDNIEWSRSAGFAMQAVVNTIANGRMHVDQSTLVWRWGKVEVRRSVSYDCEAFLYHVWIGDRFLWAGYGPE